MSRFCAPGTSSHPHVGSPSDPVSLVAQMLSNQERRGGIPYASGSQASADILDLAALRLLHQQGSGDQHSAASTRLMVPESASAAHASPPFLAPEALDYSCQVGQLWQLRQLRQLSKLRQLNHPSQMNHRSLLSGLSHQAIAAELLELSATQVPPFAALPPFPGTSPGEASCGELASLLHIPGLGMDSFPLSQSKGVCLSPAASVSMMETSEIVGLLQHIQEREALAQSLSDGGPAPVLLQPHEVPMAAARQDMLSLTDVSFGLPSFSHDSLAERAALLASAIRTTSRGAPLSPEERKVKRLAGNREAAKRLRKRHSERIEEMEGQIKRMKAMHKETCDELAEARERIAKLNEENDRLEASARELRAGAARMDAAVMFSTCASLKEMEDILLGDDC